MTQTNLERATRIELAMLSRLLGRQIVHLVHHPQAEAALEDCFVTPSTHGG
jgi:hypothetical protein